MVVQIDASLCMKLFETYVCVVYLHTFTGNTCMYVSTIRDV